MSAKRCCNFSALPPDIIEAEILPRLPVKSVLRFKSVCKSWNFFISKNPDFIKSHLVLNPNNDSSILMSGVKIKSMHHHDDNSLLQGYTEIIGSVDGLVCFFNWQCEFKGIEFAIWNPATKQCLTDIPSLPDTCLNREIDIEDFFGFGFDSVANDFKVVYVISIEEQPLVGDIYSCNRRCWRKTSPSNFLFRGSLPIKTQPVIFRGSPYWLNRHGENSPPTVIWFDVQNEIFKMLPEVGPLDKKEGKTSVLMNFRDSIAVMMYDWPLFLTEPASIYVFNERCNDWSRMSVGPLIDKGLMWEHIFLQCFKNDDVLFVSSDLELCRINLQTSAMKSLRKDKVTCSIVYGCTYSESLVFIDGMEHFNEKEDEVGLFFLRKA